MFKILTLFFLSVFTLTVAAQNKSFVGAQPFGQIDKADLELTSCDFEKDANAEVLFDVEDAFYIKGAVMDRHKRIKIFNNKGNREANIRLEYFSIDNYQSITGLEAETINLVDGKIERTKVDKKQIFTEKIDLAHSAFVFAFPNIRAGSVIEFKYRLSTYFLNIPNWYFQSAIPERYNEPTTSIPHSLFCKTQLHTNQPFVQDIATEATGNVNKHLYAMANVLSFNSEPFMSSWEDNVQSAYFQITGVFGYGGGGNLFNNWKTVGEFLIASKFFGYEMNTHISGQNEILKNAKLLPTDQKIAYLFNQVKNVMKWNGLNGWYTENGVNKAWDLKAGSGTDINLILHSLLISAGVTAYPFMVSTHEHGKINPAYPNISQFNRAVVYVKADNDNYYILDASNKYNVYNEPPADLLNSFGLLVDNDHKNFKTVFIENKKPVGEIIYINAEIKPNGTMDGVAQKVSYSYLKNKLVDSYRKKGDKMYRESLKANDNSISILSAKLENMDIDSLPLKQQINFESQLTGSGDNYIYFNSNLFSAFNKNPFLSETRLTDIDLGYMANYSITGIYKLPGGYIAEALPKNVNIVMPGSTISFVRMIAQQDGILSVRYIVDQKKSIFLKEDYQDIRGFYKKMFEMFNEQIVLKKL